ncbi:NUDIX domain-containing protein [Streptomyces sp. NPDC059761]|uniref:NUDIX hydrolase n=1 Tax=Streptomyces sp. NPDC059761 TaxID=3346937 RepID=UPI003669321C
MTCAAPNRTGSGAISPVTQGKLTETHNCESVIQARPVRTGPSSAPEPRTSWAPRGRRANPAAGRARSGPRRASGSGQPNWPGHRSTSRRPSRPPGQPGAWALLGGGREPGDTSLEDTVRRELREEAGLEPGVVEPFAVEHAAGTDGLTVPVQVFTAQWNGDPAGLPRTEGVMLAWFHPDAMARLRLSPSTLDLVRRHAQRATRSTTVPQGRALRSDMPKAGSTSVPHIVGFHLYLERDGRVLLGLRHPGSAYAGGTHHFLAGHCEQESAVACLVREAKEEASLLIDPQDVELAHVVHMVDKPGAQPRIGCVFRARHWAGTPEVLEPDRCVSWDWWPADALPEPIVPYTRAAIEGIRAGHPYTELGWT